MLPSRSARRIPEVRHMNTSLTIRAMNWEKRILWLVAALGSVTCVAIFYYLLSGSSGGQLESSVGTTTPTLLPHNPQALLKSKMAADGVEFGFPLGVLDPGKGTMIVCAILWTIILTDFLSNVSAKYFINIFTWNRPESLQRLLKSLTTADYAGAPPIDVLIYVEGNNQRDTLKIVENWPWKQGKKQLMVRTARQGLLNQIVDSWYPSTPNEFTIFLEDDIEVSPLYFQWILKTVDRYYYRETVSLAENLFGISLYTPRQNEMFLPKREFHPAETLSAFPKDQPYLHQLPCSWGALYFPRHWWYYRQYMKHHLGSDDVKLPSSPTNGWNTSWKKFFIELVYIEGWVMLYPNYDEEQSFSTNHMEKGEHIGAANELARKKDLVTVGLIQDSSILPMTPLPSFQKLAVLNLKHAITPSVRDLKEIGAQFLLQR